MNIDIREIKRQMSGREVEFISRYLNQHQLNGRNQPCPSCGGTDRYRHIKNQDGSFFCSTYERGIGDWIEHVAHTQNMRKSDVLNDAKVFLGLDNPTPQQLRDAKKRKEAWIEKQKEIDRIELDRHNLRGVMNSMFFIVARGGEITQDEIDTARELAKALKQVYGKEAREKDCSGRECFRVEDGAGYRDAGFG